MFDALDYGEGRVVEGTMGKGMAMELNVRGSPRSEGILP